MGFLSRRLSAAADKRSGRPGPLEPFWYGEPGARSGAGAIVTPDSAMRIIGVYACVRVLAEGVAQLPLHLYRRLEKGGKERAVDRPLYNVLRKQPNKWQTAFEWIEMMQGHVALRGNAYSEIVPGPGGFADQLVPLNPARMKVEQLTSGELRYVYSKPNGDKETYAQHEIFHLRGLSSDGLVGLSPITMAREGLGLALAAEAFGARFFKNDVTPGGVLEHPKEQSDRAYAHLRRSIRDQVMNVDGTGNFLILEEGMTWKQVGLSNEDAQFIEARKFQLSEIARLFRVPPHMIGDLEKATFSNIEHQSIDFVVHTLGPWLERWQQALARDVISDPDEYFAEFLVDALLKGDTKSRYEAYGSARTNRWMSVNEIRVRENMNPIEGGDSYENPNIDTAEGDPSTGTRQAGDDTELDEEETEAARMRDVIIADAAERMARAEFREQSRAPQDPQALARWCARFRETQQAYVLKTLDVLSRALACPPDWQHRVAATINARLKVELLADVVPSETERVEQIATIIKHSLEGPKP